MEVWHISHLELLRIRGNLWDNRDGWDQLLQWLMDKDLVDVWLNTMWLIWNNRNHCFHSLSCRVPVELARTTCQIKEDYLSMVVGEATIGPETITTWM